MLTAVPPGARARHGRVEIIVPGIVALFGIAAIAAAWLLDRQHHVDPRADPAAEIEVQPEPALRDGARPPAGEIPPIPVRPPVVSGPPVEPPQPTAAELEAEEEERQARAREEERQRALEAAVAARRAEEERQARAVEEERQRALEGVWRERFRGAYRKIEQLEAAEEQAQAAADSNRFVVYNMRTGQRVPTDDSFAAAERLASAKKSLAKAREELADLERQASYEAIPREWRR